MAARKAQFRSIFSCICMLVWIGHKTGLAKECTNIPGSELSHTLRGLDFEKGSVFEVKLSDDTFRSSLIRKLRTRPAAGDLPKSLKDWQPEDALDSSRVVYKLRHDNRLPHGDRSAIRERNHVRRSTSTDLFDSFVRTRAQRRTSSHHEDDFKVDGNNRTLTSTSSATSSPAIRRLELEPQPMLKEVSLHRVTLAADSLHGIAQHTNLEYLLMLDVDSLVWNFRVTAGLPAPGSPYGGWEHPEVELRGHFVGHYLSAAALMWASTHNSILEEKMTRLVDALEECQEQLGTGYLSAFPSELFDRFEAIESVWAPYYSIHKIMAGLLDQYNLAGSEKAFGMLLWMAKYFLRRVETVIHKYSIERHWESLNEEVGGMNDVMYRLFMVTHDPGHLKLAHLFDKPCFLGLLALQTDGLSGFHSNTHIPLVVGAQMRFEATGDKLYADLSKYFMTIINTSHRYATGGTSSSEFWTDPNRNGNALSTEDQETCTTYNMLKVARNMFRWTRNVSYADYYERALVNGILGIQRGKEPGVMIYMLPQAPGNSKAISYHGWGTPYNSFWCCYGTGIESFSKLGDSIYFEEYGTNHSLYIAQFVSSHLTWDTMGLLLIQKVIPLSSDDPFLHVTLEFYELPQGANGHHADLSLRIPTWTIATATHIRLNGLSLGAPKPGNYFTISRAWKAGDVLHLDLPVSLTLEKIQDDRKKYSSLHAILFGPYLLAGMTDRENEIGAVNTSSLSSWIIPVPASYSAQLYSFSQDLFVHTVPPRFEGSEGKRLGGQVLVLSSVNASAGMKPVPLDGTNEAAQCTFRLNSPSVGTSDGSIIGALVSFELYSQPGKLLVHTGINRKLAVVDMNNLQRYFRESRGPSNNTNSKTHNDILIPESDVVEGFKEGYELFQVLPGLSGNENTLSFQAAALNGCFIISGLDASITLQCQIESNEMDPEFRFRASFSVKKGLATYNPVSFLAKGMKNQFLLFPIYAYQDERYTTYFDLTST